MKALITIFALILFTSTLFAQDYVAVNNIEIETEYRRKSSKKTTTKSSVSILATEIYETSNFDYRKFLKDAEELKERYRIGSETFTKKELIKLFRKGTRRSETVIEFETYLLNINPQFLKGISKRESVAIFNKFREGTLHAYLDSLPNGIF